MYSNKEKLHYFQRLQNSDVAEHDLALLSKKQESNIDKYSRSPRRYADEILYALLDIFPVSIIVKNRREWARREAETKDDEGTGVDKAETKAGEGADVDNPETKDCEGADADNPETIDGEGTDVDNPEIKDGEGTEEPKPTAPEEPETEAPESTETDDSKKK